ncbi:hypothetical protein IWW38_004215, partial [Coemansia aciculifera]
MSTLTPLQTLPLHVVQIIVNHVVGNIRIWSTDVIVDSNAYRVLLKPLLQVCNNFRTVAFSFYCKHFRLSLGTESWFKHAMQHIQTGCEIVGYSDKEYPGFPTHHLVKKLDIELDVRAIYSGKALRMLMCAPYNSCVFPLARHITLTLIRDGEERDGEESDEYDGDEYYSDGYSTDGYGSGRSDSDEYERPRGKDECKRPAASYELDEYDEIDSLVAAENFVAFMQQIRLIAPVASKYAVQKNGYYYDTNSGDGRLLSKLISQLHQSSS